MKLSQSMLVTIFFLKLLMILVTMIIPDDPGDQDYHDDPDVCIELSEVNVINYPVSVPVAYKRFDKNSEFL